MECRKHRKTVDPTCESHKECRWIPGDKKNKTKGVCVSKVEVSTAKSKPTTKQSTKPTGKPTKTQCLKYRKTIDPTCESHPECEWVVGKGCQSKTASSIKTQPTTKPTTHPKSSPSDKPDPLFGPKLKKMTGFHHLAYFDNLPGGRKILLLGEFHNKYLGCPTCTQQEGCSIVTDYLKNLDQAAKKAGHCLDVFVESMKHKKDKLGGGKKPKKKYQIENVTDLRKNFTDLTQVEKNTRYPNTRFHDWDLRYLYYGLDVIDFVFPVLDVFQPTKKQDQEVAKKRIVSSFNEYPGSLREKVRLIFNYYATGYQLSKSQAFVTSLIKLIPGYTEAKLQQNIKHIEYVRYKIHKAVEKIDKRLNPYFTRKSLFDRYFDVWWRNFLKKTRSPADIIELSVDNARIFFMFTSCFFTDLYLFARMFSVFRKSKQTEGVGCQKQMYPKNIIVYGGSVHTQLVGILIHDIFGEFTHRSYVNPSVSCLEFTEARQFF
jgi:hypothetical protein